MKFTLAFEGMNLHGVDFRDVLGKISLVDGLDVSPVVLDSNFFEFGFVLVVPGTMASSLLFGESAGTRDCGFAAIAHLDVHGDIAFVLSAGVSLDHEIVLLVFALGCLREVAAFELTFVEAVEEGQRDVFVLLMGEFPVDPLIVLNLEVLENTQVDVPAVETN
jgi:hypothetical protein